MEGRARRRRHAQRPQPRRLQARHPSGRRGRGGNSVRAYRCLRGAGDRASLSFRGDRPDATSAPSTGYRGAGGRAMAADGPDQRRHEHGTGLGCPAGPRQLRAVELRPSPCRSTIHPPGQARWLSAGGQRLAQPTEDKGTPREARLVHAWPGAQNRRVGTRQKTARVPRRCDASALQRSGANTFWLFSPGPLRNSPKIGPAAVKRRVWRRGYLARDRCDAGRDRCTADATIEVLVDSLAPLTRTPELAPALPAGGETGRVFSADKSHHPVYSPGHCSLSARVTEPEVVLGAVGLHRPRGQPTSRACHPERQRGLRVSDVWRDALGGRRASCRRELG